MNLEIASLLALLAAIIIGFIRKSNVGIISMGLALVLSLVFRIDSNDVLKGFSSSLCVQMVGITYLFSIINANGTLTILANKMVGLVGKKTCLIPFVMFVLGYCLCAVGPGAIPSLAIIPVLAVPVAVSAGINPVMTSLIGQMGVQAGRMSPMTPEAAVVKNLMEAQGIKASTVTIGWCLLITEIVLALAVYVYYKGWQVKKGHTGKETENAHLERTHIYSVLGLVVMVAGVLLYSWNVGLTGFLIGSILIVLKAGDEGKSIKAIPWNVILMVLGVGMLMNIITVSGGIDVLVRAMETIMDQKTASVLMAIAAGVMSFFSSGLGVVFPTLIPTAQGLASGLGVNALELVAVIVVGGTVTGFSPISTAGALVMAAVSQEETAEGKGDHQNQMFLELFGVAFLALIILGIFAVSGVYGKICG